MTTREELAGMAMQGLLADPEDRSSEIQPGETCYDAVARMAQMQADALIYRLALTQAPEPTPKSDSQISNGNACR